MSELALYVRRLARDELDYVMDAQKFSAGLSRRFRNHSQWIKRVLVDLKSGRRIAFGAFVDACDRSNIFVGSVLLKRSDSGVVQAKNLLANPLSTDAPDATISEQVGEIQLGLMARVGAFCRQRGYSQIEVDLFIHGGDPRSQSCSGISVLLSQGYILQSIRASDSFARDTFYIFSRRVPLAYTGDPGNEKRDCQYLIEDHFSFTEVNGPVNLELRGESADTCRYYTFEVPFSTSSDKRIRGVCLVDLGQTSGQGVHQDCVRLLKDGFPPGGDNSFTPEFRNALTDSNVRVLLSLRGGHNCGRPSILGAGT